MAVPKLRFKADNGSEFPEWEEKRLGDVGAVAMCKRVFKEQTSDTGEVPFFKIGTFGGKPDAYISYALFKELKEKYPYPKKGTVLLSASGTVGRQVMYNGENAYYQDSNIVWLEHDDTVIDGFLNQFYSIVKWKGLEGSTIKRLYNKTILDTVFYRPSLPEQQKIASFLSTIDEIIQSTESELTAWQERKKGVMQKIFNREVRFKADDGSEFPEWEEKRLGELYCKNVEKNTELKFESSRTISIASMQFNEKGNGANEDSLSSYKVLRLGDIAFEGHENKEYSHGRFVLNDIGDGIMSPRFSCMRPVCTQEYGFWKYYIHSEMVMRNILVRSTKKGTMMHELVISDFLKQSINVPSLPEQRKIADCLSSLDDVINQIQAELSAWKEFKKGLLQQMFV